jgi:hypothetical protein
VSFDAMLCDLAANTDRTTARVTAKSMEYSADRLRLADVAWPRPTVLVALTVTTAMGVTLVPAAATRRNGP